MVGLKGGTSLNRHSIPAAVSVARPIAYGRDEAAVLGVNVSECCCLAEAQFSSLQRRCSSLHVASAALAKMGLLRHTTSFPSVTFEVSS